MFEQCSEKVTLNSSLTLLIGETGGCFGGILVTHPFTDSINDPMTKKLQALIKWLILQSGHNFNAVGNCAFINLFSPAENWQHVTEA